MLLTSSRIKRRFYLCFGYLNQRIIRKWIIRSAYLNVLTPNSPSLSALTHRGTKTSQVLLRLCTKFKSYSVKEWNSKGSGFKSRPYEPAGHRAAGPVPMSFTWRVWGWTPVYTKTGTACALDTSHATIASVNSVNTETIGLFRGFFNRKRERRKFCCQWCQGFIFIFFYKSSF